MVSIYSLYDYSIFWYIIESIAIVKLLRVLRVCTQGALQEQHIIRIQESPYEQV